MKKQGCKRTTTRKREQRSRLTRNTLNEGRSLRSPNCPGQRSLNRIDVSVWCSLNGVADDDDEEATKRRGVEQSAFDEATGWISQKC